jgi:hypothetical protein
MFWKPRGVIPTHTRAFSSSATLSHLIVGGLLLALLPFSACLHNDAAPTAQSQRRIPPSPTSKLTPIAQKRTPTPQRITGSPTSNPTQEPKIITPTPGNNSPQHNHVPPGTFQLFASITFTPSTTFDQAVAILKAAGQTPYPWICDDPRTPVPPSLAQQRTEFLSSHQLRLSYPNDNQLNQIASSPQVVSVDPYPAYICP